MSAPWIVVTIDDVYQYREARAFDETHAARFTETMHNVADVVRGKVKSCPNNKLSATPYAVPPELKWCACILIVEGLVTGIPGMDVSDEERSRFKRAWETLDQVMQCKFLISTPDDAVDSGVQTAPMTVVTSVPKVTTRAQTAGLW